MSPRHAAAITSTKSKDEKEVIKSSVASNGTSASESQPRQASSFRKSKSFDEKQGAEKLRAASALNNSKVYMKNVCFTIGYSYSALLIYYRLFIIFFFWTL